MKTRAGKPHHPSGSGHDRAWARLRGVASRRAAAILIGSGFFALLFALSLPGADGALLSQRTATTSAPHLTNQIDPLSTDRELQPIETGAASDRSRPEPGFIEVIAVEMTSSSPPSGAQPAQ